MPKPTAVSPLPRIGG